MSLHFEDRELQIRLTELQIEHQYVASFFIGIIALEFSALLALQTIYFSLYGNLEASFIRDIITILMVAMVPVVYITYFRFRKIVKKLDEEIKELREKYVW